MPNLDLTELSAELEKRAENMRNPEQLMFRAGKAGVAVLKEHFESRAGKFWPSFADPRVTHLDKGSVTADSATILISPTQDVPYGNIMWHKTLGGPIRAIPPRKMLAIPTKNNPDPAKWPSMYGDGELVALWGKNGPYALLDARMLKRIDRSERGKKSGKGKLQSRIEAYGRHKIETDDSGKAVRSLHTSVGLRIQSANVSGLDKADIERAMLFFLVRGQTKPQRIDEDALPDPNTFCAAVIARLDGG